MGAPEREAGSLRSERPQHHVAVAAFCLGRHAVTIAQWCAAMGAMPEWHDRRRGGIPGQPASSP